MQLPKVVHPTVFTVNGHKLQVIAYCVLTESQARAAAVLFLRTHKLPKKPDPSKVIKLMTMFDQDSLGLLGP